MDGIDQVSRTCSAQGFADTQVEALIATQRAKLLPYGFPESRRVDSVEYCGWVGPERLTSICRYE